MSLFVLSASTWMQWEVIGNAYYLSEMMFPVPIPKFNYRPPLLSSSTSVCRTQRSSTHVTLHVNYSTVPTASPQRVFSHVDIHHPFIFRLFRFFSRFGLTDDSLIWSENSPESCKICIMQCYMIFSARIWRNILADDYYIFALILNHHRSSLFGV